MKRAAWAVHWGVGALFLVLYSATLAGGVLPADSGEYQLNGALLGVSHPPGFALYTLASWVISRAPGVAPALAINWLSALMAAGTLALVSRTVARLTGWPAAGAATALALGFTTTFWAQATTANIRMPAALAVAWGVERLAALWTEVQNQSTKDTKNTKGEAGSWKLKAGAGKNGVVRGLAWLALALGVGVAHHASLVFMAAVLGLSGLWLSRGALRRPKALAWAA